MPQRPPIVRIKYQQKRVSSSKKGYNRSHYRLRKMIMSEQPICNAKGCNELGIELHHIDGDSWNRSRNNLVMLCKSCHSKKTASEGGGGWNKPYMWPKNIPKPAIPVTMICGPSGAGKTTFTKNNANKEDIVIDLDEIRERISGLPSSECGEEWFKPAINERNRMLKGLSKANGKRKAWFIFSGASLNHRRFWQQALNTDIVVLEIDKQRCMERIRKDKSRLKDLSEYEAWIDKWWKNYVSDPNEKVIREF